MNLCKKILLIALLFLPAQVFGEPEKNKDLSPCQKKFVRGYEAYKNGDLDAASWYFSECDGKYPVLQEYITEFLKKISKGGEKFIYVDHVKKGEAEIKRLEDGLSMVRPACQRLSVAMAGRQAHHERGTKAHHEREKPLILSLSKDKLFDLARAYFRVRKYKEAGEIFRQTANSSPSHRLTSLEYLATALTRQGLYPEAIDIHRQITDEYKNNRAAKEKALFKVGFLFMDSGDYKAAEQEFMRLQKMHSSYRADEVKWHLAWCAYKSGDFKTALARFRGIKSGRALYWQAVTLEKMGRGEDAQAAYREVADKFPLGYYGMMAGKKLGEGDSRSCHPCGSRDPVNAGDSCSPLTTCGDTLRRNDKQGGDKRLDKLIELDHLGIGELVAIELERLIKERTKDINRPSLLEIAKRNDAWHAVNIIGRSEGIWEASYPKAYYEDVQRLAMASKVSPFLVWAMMREESTFKTDAVSRSGAIGLMQLMPATAERMAGKRLARNEPHPPLMVSLSNHGQPILRPAQDERSLAQDERFFETLLTPKKNIELGIRYINFLLKRYDGNEIYAVAAYNAGEEAVDRWIGNRNRGTHTFMGKSVCPPDEFVEEIPFKETQNYVRKVLQAKWIYKRVYRQ